MATIIETGNGGFIAGDPPDSLGEGEHWCEWCGGEGLDYIEHEVTTCSGCIGACVYLCTDTACLVHSSLHPLIATR